LVVVADTKRVHQNKAPTQRGFRPERSKKASHYVKKTPAAAATGSLPAGVPRAYMAASGKPADGDNHAISNPKRV
jgi:hypothetical protein